MLELSFEAIELCQETLLRKLSFQLLVASLLCGHCLDLLGLPLFSKVSQQIALKEQLVNLAIWLNIQVPLLHLIHINFIFCQLLRIVDEVLFSLKDNLILDPQELENCFFCTF